MANETNKEFSVALNNYFQTLGTLAQQLLELVNVVIKTAGSFIEPLGKTASELVCNTSTTVTKVFQGTTPTVTPKK